MWIANHLESTDLRVGCPLQAPWTIEITVDNETKYTLYPAAPTSAATWYGWVRSYPQTVDGQDHSGDGGSFQSQAAVAQGITGISVYSSPDQGKLWVLLVMMPHGTGEQNKTKVCSTPLSLDHNALNTA